MTPPVTPEATKLDPWYVRPGIILPVLALCVVVTALLAPSQVTGRDGDQRATTYSAQPMGARMLFELSEKMGWHVRREINPVPTLDSVAVLTVLDPTTALTPADVHQTLQHVRAGGALLAALGDGTSELNDSIGVYVDPQGSYLELPFGVTTGTVGVSPGCKPVTGRDLVNRQGLWVGLPTLLALKDSMGPVAHPQRTFVSSQSIVFVGGRKTKRPSVVGFPLGAGRVVVSADPDVFRNDAIRECTYGFDVAVVRMLEYLRDGGERPRTSLVFDEYHLAKVSQTGALNATQNYLTGTASGHALLQLCIAGLVLLLALATRVLPPRDDTRVDRRSPLEHVDALARAYAQVGATQTAVQRLLRGVRRRTDRTATRAISADADDLFLTRVAEIHPALESDVARVRNALKATVSRNDFKEVGKAIDRIERSVVEAAQVTHSRIVRTTAKRIHTS
jgi:hypothetical protein